MERRYWLLIPKTTGEAFTCPFQQPSMEQSGDARVSTRPSPPNPPDKNLLLLGLQQLLNKSLGLPCAVVQPRIQPTASSPVKSSYSPIKSSHSPSSSDSGSESDASDKNEAQSNPRKRKRNAASDLSVVERREKRKMMNRVAAQNARDRKKHYVEDLEKKVLLLEAQNKQLLQENQSLKEHTTTLATEKQQLEQRLSTSLQADLQADLRALVKESLLESSGSAAPHVSRQKKQVPVALLLQAWMALSMTSWLVSLEKDAVLVLPSHCVTRLTESRWEPPLRDLLLRLQAWWGAGQTTWNPPRN